MKIFTAQKVSKIDAYTIKHEPIKSIDLMERAATQCSEWLKENFISDIFEISKNFKIFVGPGNNGGDGLVVARHLTEEVNKWFFENSKVKIYIVKFTDKLSEDFKINLERLKKINNNIQTITDKSELPKINNDDIIIDAIFGSGLTRPVEGFPAKVIKHINNSTNKSVISIDVPSGLFGEENHKQKQVIIKADYTLTFEFPFLSFFFPENQDFITNFKVLPIGLSKKYIEKSETKYFTVEKKYISDTIKTRKKYAHKGNFGHGLLIAGSYGTMGAAVLSAKAAHRTGIGLLTAHATKCCIEIMQNSSPETMISTEEVTQKYPSKVNNIQKYNSIGIGPGIGLHQNTALLLQNIIENSTTPLVIDADAITLLGKNKKYLDNLPKNSILTPHLKEFERIAGKTANNYQRNLKQIEFSKKYGIYIILKGANTAISCPDGKCYFNQTGNQGMATGGSGDVLTGMILALLAQGYKPKEAAILGVYLHGAAGDIAAEKFGYYSLIASDIIDNIHNAIDCVK